MRIALRRPGARFLFFILFVAATVNTRARDVPSAVRAAQAEVVDARLPRGLAEELSIRLNRASVLAAAATSVSLDHAAEEIWKADELLHGVRARVLPAETRNHLLQRFEELSKALRMAPTAVSVPVTVRALTVAEDGTTAAAGAGVSVRVDGVDAGTTGADSTVAIIVTEGDHVFAAASAVDTGGSTTAAIVANTTPSVDVTMTVGGDYSYPAILDIAEAADSVVAPDLASFTVHLHDDAGTTIPVAQLQRIDLESSSGLTALTSQFSIAQGGSLAVRDPASFRASLLDKFGPFTIAVRAIDAQGRTWRSSAKFDIGRHHVSGSVTGPGAVPVGGIPFRVTNQRNGFSFWITTTSSGAVVYPNALPEGLYIAHCEVVSGGIRYFVRSSFVLSGGNTTFTAPLKTLADQ